MLKKTALCGMAALCLFLTVSHAQSVDSFPDKLVNFPSRLFGKIRSKTASLNDQLTRKTEKYLQRMMRQERRIREKMSRVDSVGVKNLFANSFEQYEALSQKIRTDSGTSHQPLSGTYAPSVDSLQGMLSFLQKNSQLISSSGQHLPPSIQTQLQGSVSQLQALQAKMADADQVKAFIQQRKEQIGQYISQHANLQNLLGSSYAGMNREVYYYSQQVREYKELLNHPDQLEQKALSLLNKLPAFQNFMKNNSQLTGLFNLPGNYGSPQALVGLQTRDQVSQLVQNQVSAGGTGGAAALQANLESAQSQLDSYKDKLSKLGAGNGDIDMPDFKPNEQKTKTFWKRLEYGTNMQTIRTNYFFPTTTDFGLSIGYKLNGSNTAGLGASYKVGWGSGIHHIAFSSEGVGLRSFIDIRIKGSFSATGGLEYNYTTPFTSVQQLRRLDYWTQSGLIGVTKTVSMKSRVFKKTKLQLLWDFLSYRQVPKTQPILFRVGYTF